MNNLIGFLQGRLTPSEGRGIQFFPYGAWEREFSDAKEIGATCIEFLIQRKDWGNTDHPLLTSGGIERIKNVAAQSGIYIPSIHAYYEPRVTFSEEMATIARSAEAIGASVILLSFFKHAALSSPEAKEEARQYLTNVMERIPQSRVRFGLEAELPAAELLQFITSLPNPDRFGVYYDLGNQYACSFPVAEELRILGKKIVGVHIKDRLPQVLGETESSSVPLGTGSAHLPEALTVLKQIGYTSPLILQGARQEGRDDIDVVREYIASVQHYTSNV